MSTQATQLAPPPEKGTAKGDFFHKDENPFQSLDAAHPPTVEEAEDELETNDLQFKALKQDVLLQLFEPGLEDDDTFPASGNLFTIGNRTEFFACGCPNGLLFGKTELLRQAFEEAKPKTTAVLKNAIKIDLPATPTHVRFTADEEAVIVALPQQGILILDCSNLQQRKSLAESTKSSVATNPVIDMVPNPRNGSQLAYITRTFTDSPYGGLFLYDIATQKSEQLDPSIGFTCLTFSHEGESLLAGTKSGEALYYNLNDPGKAPLRRPPPTDLPEADDDSWWIIQGVDWLDTSNQLVIYNRLSHPSDPPIHDYQAYIISNPSPPSTFSFQYLHLPVPPVDAFGNTSKNPWFHFQSLHNWHPSLQTLLLSSVTAGSDIGLLVRSPPQHYRIWSIADATRRAMIPYNMDKNEETIVVGMQFDFTSKKGLEKPFYPDENPAECAALPVLWVLNTEGQVAGWTVLYVPGIVAGERALEMRGVEKQEQYWQREWETRRKEAGQVNDQERRDREVWEKAWQESKGGKPVQTISTPEKPRPTDSSTQAPAQAPPQPSPQPQPQTQTATPPTQSSHPTFGQPSQLGTSSFGQPSQLGGTIPGQSNVFGQSTGLGAFNAPRQGNTSSVGFAKYSSTPSTQGSAFLSGSAAQPNQSAFLSGTSQSGSFLSAATGGSFLQPGQTSSFLSGGQGNTFTKPGQDQGFAKFATSTPPTSQNQGFAKYATSTPRGFGTPQNMTTPSSFSEGGFLGSRPAASSTPPFGTSPRGSLSERTQSLTSPSSRNQSFDMLDDSSQEDTESDESDMENSEESDEGESSVRVDALNFGDALNLDGRQPSTSLPELTTPVKKDVASPEQSPSSVGDGEYVKVGIPVTPSPEKGKSGNEETKDITPSARDKSRQTETSSASITPLPRELKPQVDTLPTPIPATPKKPTPLAIEKAISPPDPFSTPSRPSKPTTSPAVPPLKDPVSKDSIAPAASPARNKVELRQFGPVSGSAPISSRLSESGDLSDAFRLVVEQVSKELAKLSEITRNFSQYIQYQKEEDEPKSTADLDRDTEEWTMADLHAVERIVDDKSKSVEEILRNVPSMDDSIQELEKSLKKMEAKKIELDRFVRAVRDPEVRESIHSRKLAPDFARQQKEIRHSLQAAEEKLHDLTSALTILKADLADEKGSFGIQAPSTAGIYRVINNVFSRLQLLSAKVTALEKRLQATRGVRFSSPGAESVASRSSVTPTTPVMKLATRSSPARKSPGIRTPGMNSSPGMRASPLRRTMLDEKLDQWEAEEIIKDLHRKREFQQKIEALLKGTKPLSSEASM